MKEYWLEQKRERATENAVFQFSKVLSFLLKFTASFLKSFITAAIDAFKLFFRF